MSQPTKEPRSTSVGTHAVAELRPQGRHNLWASFTTKRPELAQFLVFAAINTVMTVLQLVMMPVAKGLFGTTHLVDVNFQWLSLGGSGQEFFIFDYLAGSIASGGGGGLAYFLAVQITLAVAQIINFFLQRNVTFKSNTNPWRAAAWYAVAYVIITFGAAALQGFYKTAVYHFFITTWGLGSGGETLADMTTMIINALISVAVYYPIFKIIFRKLPENQWDSDMDLPGIRP